MFYFLSKHLPLFIYPLGLSCLLLTAALFLRRFQRWQMRIVAVVLTLLWLGGNQLVTIILLRSLEWQYLPSTEIPHGDVIVVLGGATRGQSYPRPTHEVNEAGDRLLYAAWLYHQGAAPKILISGGGAEWVGPSLGPEAPAMAYFMSVAGVPEDALTLEIQSRNTYENAVETSKLLEGQNIERIILVTSAMHMPRSIKIFSRFGCEVIPAPTDFLLTQADWDYYTRPNLAIQFRNLLPRADNLNVTTDALKEYLGILVYGLRGWL